MGCDIHGHFELKIKDRWIYYAPANFDRNYSMFAKLAGVRDCGAEPDKIDDPRGLPTDITEMTRIHAQRWEGDAHSHSWVNSQEYAKVMNAIRAEISDVRLERRLDRVWLFGNSFYDFHQYRESFPEFVEDFRMVFWFDN